MNEIGERIKQIRENNKISIRELSRRTGFAHSYISQLEKGDISPTIDKLKSIAEALNSNLNYLLYGLDLDDEWIELLKLACESSVSKEEFRRFLEYRSVILNQPIYKSRD